jgi:hypothetical protein
LVLLRLSQRRQLLLRLLPATLRIGDFLSRSFKVALELFYGSAWSARIADALTKFELGGLSSLLATLHLESADANLLLPLGDIGLLVSDILHALPLDLP